MLKSKISKIFLGRGQQFVINFEMNILQHLKKYIFRPQRAFDINTKLDQRISQYQISTINRVDNFKIGARVAQHNTYFITKIFQLGMNILFKLWPVFFGIMISILKLRTKQRNKIHVISAGTINITTRMNIFKNYWI
uniref:Transmembrane protein n=1 Tax=Panagrolaimus sp. JU765 TaxID=591449 RepID=A0AC34QYT4_9BILA